MSFNFSRSLENSFLLQFAQLLKKMKRPFSATTDKDFGDSYVDISRTERRLIRNTTKTYSNTGTYLFLKFFKRVDNEHYVDQQLTLTASEFHQLTNNKENTGMQPGAEEEDLRPTIKREKPSNKQFSKMPRLCSSGKLNIIFHLNVSACEHLTSFINSFFNAKIIFLKP